MNNSITLMVFFCIALAVTSCNKQSVPASVADETIEHQPVPETGYTDMNTAKWEKGIDFWAVGNEPFWSIDLDFDGEFTLKRLGQPDIGIPAQKAQQFESGTEYSGSSMSFDLVIRIYDETCTDNMSGQLFAHKVEVDYREKGAGEFLTYSGCGNYVNDPQLDETWVVWEMYGLPLDSNDFPKGLPFLEFKPAERKIEGFDGCNNFGGDYENRGKKLFVGPVFSTKMACPGIEEYGYLSNLLSDQSFSYQIAENELRLIKDFEVIAKMRAVK